MDNSLIFFSLLLRGVEDILNNPPDDAPYGQGYLVGPTPTGAWAGRANCIAMRNQQNSWAFLPDHTLSDGPQHGLGLADVGLEVYVRGASARYRWGGTSWEEVSSGGGGGTASALSIPLADATPGVLETADIAVAATQSSAFPDASGYLYKVALSLTEGLFASLGAGWQLRCCSHPAR